MTLEEIAERVARDLGVETTKSSVDRFYVQRAISFKKSLHASEQDRPDVAEARENWKARQASFDPDRLVFIDEAGANTKMVRVRGRCLRGARLLAKVPWGHWKTTTFTAGLRRSGLVAPFVLDGPMDGAAFLVYVEKVLAPTADSGASRPPIPE